MFRHYAPQAGYALKSLNRTPDIQPDTVMLTESDCEHATFNGYHRIDGADYYRFKIGGRAFYFQLCSHCVPIDIFEFDDSDVEPSSSWDGRIRVPSRSHLIVRPLWFHNKGLSETASGYGGKLTTQYMLQFNGRLHRIYCACYSNSGTCYIISGKQRIIVDCV